MPLYIRGKTWWVRFTDPSGKRIQESTGTSNKVAAQEYHDHRKAEAWRVSKLDERPEYTWEQAVIRWFQERSHKKSLKDDKSRLISLDPFLSGKYLSSIKRDLIDLFTLSRKSDGVTNATVNRALQLLRAILRAAEREWDWIERAPHVRLLPEPKRRIRWLTIDEADHLLSELPEHLKLMARFTLCTGLRESNVTGLLWSQINFNNSSMSCPVKSTVMKTKSIALPLCSQALAIVRACEGNDPEFVFTFRGKPVARCNNSAWRNALKRAEIEDFRWHDLRHTWASWHVQNGTPLHVLQELGGWESVEMVRRYAHLSVDHLASYVGNQLNNKNQSGTNLVHEGKEND